MSTISNSADGGVKLKIATMNEEIERVERVMKRRNNSRLSSSASSHAHDEIGLTRTTSTRP